MSNTIRYQMWTEKECEQVFEAALKVLNTTGMLIQHEGIRKMLKDAGCEVEGEIVKILPEIVKKAIETAPKEIQMYDRFGNPAMRLAADNEEFYLGPVLCAAYCLDIETGEKRAARYEDAVNSVLVCDALPAISWSQTCYAIGEGCGDAGDVYECHATLKNTTKPFMYWSAGTEHAQAELDMIEAVVGAENLTKKPIGICLTTPMDPLKFTEEGAELIAFLAKKNMPQICICGTNMGCTAPIHITGSILVGICDALAGLVITQIANPGAPYIMCKFSDCLNMENGSMTHSRPESISANIASCDIMRYIGLPYCLNFGDTNAGVFDEVAAFDITLQLTHGLLSGCNMNLCIGAHESGTIGGLESLVFGDSVLGHIKKSTQYVPVTEETLAIESIDEVGPGGNFLCEEDTFELCHSMWTPGVFRDRTYTQYLEDGKRTMGEVLNERVKEIVKAGPKNPLDEETCTRLDEIVKRFEK